MSLFKRPYDSRKNETGQNPFVEFYFSMQNANRFPFQIAFENLQYLETQIHSDEDMLFCCLEDSVFSSLQATYYEEMLMSLKDNFEMAQNLIHKFNVSKETRDNLILKQAQTHVNYIIRGGMCPGCDQCDNHRDVDELLMYYQNGDLNFFIKLYLGMQAIHLGFEELIFDYLPRNMDQVEYVNRDSIFTFRSSIFNHAEENFEKLFLGA